MAQWSYYAEIKYSFLSDQPVTRTYFAIDKSKQDLHNVIENNGHIIETYYNRSQNLLFTRQDDQLVQASTEQAEHFDFEAQTAALSPNSQNLLKPDDVISYSIKDNKTTVNVKYSQKFAELYEGIGADKSCSLTIVFWGANMDELYETITVTGDFSVGGITKHGTATITQKLLRLWNVPAPEWLIQNE